MRKDKSDDRKNVPGSEDTLYETASEETNCQPEEGGTSGDEVEILSAADFVSQLNEAQQKYDDLYDKYQRSLAEFDNFRKRTAKEKTSMYDDGIVDTVLKLLPVIDNFERALNSATDKEDGMYKGVAMIYKQLEEMLVSAGVEAVCCKGEPFDPNLHYAVAHEKNGDYEENIVIEEMQKGYKYKDKVIRPSMVKVAN